MKKKLLLHTCCAPCAVYVVHQLKPNYDVTLFFYNPNIHPDAEYHFREQELAKISKQLDWETIFHPGDPGSEEWFRLTQGYENEPERGKRCTICFHMRLAKTFALAQEKGFDIVATTLSISPYKVTSQINEVGNELSRSVGIEFLAENFKKQNGYHIGRKMAMELGIKHQVYCGCVFSKQDREKSIMNKKQKSELIHEKNS